MYLIYKQHQVFTGPILEVFNSQHFYMFNFINEFVLKRSFSHLQRQLSSKTPVWNNSVMNKCSIITGYFSNCFFHVGSLRTVISDKYSYCNNMEIRHPDCYCPWLSYYKIYWERGITIKFLLPQCKDLTYYNIKYPLILLLLREFSYLCFLNV